MALYSKPARSAAGCQGCSQSADASSASGAPGPSACIRIGLKSNQLPFRDAQAPYSRQLIVKVVFLFMRPIVRIAKLCDEVKPKSGQEL